MCGIWFCLGNYCTANAKYYVEKIKARGPEGTRINVVARAGTMGFNRLAINGLNNDGMQPFECGPVISYGNSSIHSINYMCNGEIYNWQEIRAELVSKGTVFYSDSDTEVLLKSIGINGLESTLKKIRGIFAFALFVSIHAQNSNQPSTPRIQHRLVSCQMDESCREHGWLPSNFQLSHRARRQS
jgi:asparagine synthetase B (glutamine-hydrolysing)